MEEMKPSASDDRRLLKEANINSARAKFHQSIESCRVVLAVDVNVAIFAPDVLAPHKIVLAEEK